MQDSAPHGRSTIRGAISMGTIVWLVLLVGGGYAGWQFAQPWLRYFEFKADIAATVKLAQVLNAQQMRERIDQISADSGVWIDHPNEQIQLTYRNGHARVQTRWSEAAEFPFGIEYWFDFSVDEKA